MFAPYCETHRARVLLSPSSIRAVHVHADGTEVHFRCHCGTEGVWRTGRRPPGGGPGRGRAPGPAPAELAGAGR